MSRASENWAKRPKVLELWRLGNTEQAIADALQMPRTSVQSIIRSESGPKGTLPAVLQPSQSLVPDPPGHLDAAGRAVWFHVFEMTPWLDPSVDFLMVQMLAEQFDVIRALQASYDEHPEPLVQGVTKGSRVINPLLREIRATEAFASTLLKQLGLGPDSRIRLRTIAAQGDALRNASDLVRGSESFSIEPYQEDTW